MSISSYPEEFARRAATVLGLDIEASVIVRDHQLSLRAGSSSPASARCDQAETAANAGPCVDAMDKRSVRVVPNIADSTGWERWREQALAEGYVSALAVPALVREDLAVALNLYSRSPDPWTPEVLTAADGYAQLIASMVRVRLQLAEIEDAAAGLYRNMGDALVAERAVGAIMQTNGCSEDQARHILESASKHRSVDRREVAETILRALVDVDAGDQQDPLGG
ncbi:GAF and ANTAR domain-containing protein [Isoptericola sp. S6320L]|uniref:GAF and ANTAR domain-containing protein n=1 Tax=Isoptericola sp. S6320L TaxID=2926411 RepID=UPI001FF61742|nr:GAF and ANTAR domain-containing protein [Isoptericola sp. S6320L]MCK0118246.1 GAF and ANTAR domain-containing protein [Isoptericola sp. S6320L]